MNHSSCDHERTPKARAACRKSTPALPLVRDPFILVTEPKRIKRQARVEPSPNAECAAESFALVMEWMAEATELDVLASGPVMGLSGLVWTFHGRAGALVVSVDSQGVIRITLDRGGLKSNAYSRAYSLAGALEAIA